MDLNQKYADHQEAVLKASSATDEIVRTAYLATATEIATQIKRHQSRLGAAASCAWSASTIGSSTRLLLQNAGEGT